MLVLGLQVPLDVFECEAVCYCRKAKDIVGHETVLCRLNEYEFLFGFLNFEPSETIYSGEIVFNPEVPGFVWRCPKPLTEELSGKRITMEDVLSYWSQMDESIGLVNVAFSPATPSMLKRYFPPEVLKIQPVELVLEEETFKVNQLPVHHTAFFKDVYDGYWILNRSNISTVALVQVQIDFESRTFKYISEAYILNELTLFLLKKEFPYQDWDELTLGDAIRLKNLMQRFDFSKPLPEAFKTCFRVYSNQEMDGWSERTRFEVVREG